MLVLVYGVFAIGVGIFFARRAGRGVDSFFVGDRKMSWWMAGTSIVATTFAADTPLAVTGIVATGGISGNWIWWCWGIAHLTATFLFARLWRRSGVITDAEIIELRYSGKPAAALRGFKAVYFGLFINCLTMAWVIAAMVKISRAFFDVPEWTVIVGCVTVAVAYTVLGGFQSVVYSDLVQFALGMAGAIVLAAVVVGHFGGMGSAASGSEAGLLGALAKVSAQTGKSLGATLDFIPAADHPTTPLVYFIVLLVAGWWRYAEGTGYTVQRLAACKNEGHAQGASLWFTVAHNALRPWPWIIVGLAALVFYPQLGASSSSELKSSDGRIHIAPATLDVAAATDVVVHGAPSGAVLELLGQRVPIVVGKDGAGVARVGPFSESGIVEARVTAGDTSWSLVGVHVQLADREMAYPLLMGRFLPPGLLGLVIVSLLAAFMSTIDTHTNWGASYLVRDVYQRFLRPQASERECVRASRIAVVLMAAIAGLASAYVASIGEVWRFLVTLGAGLGSVTAARWYWQRVTAHAELAALGVTTLVAVGLQLFCTPTLFGGPNGLFIHAVPAWAQIVIVATASLCAWIPVSLFGPKNSPATLRRFAERVRPLGPGWRGVADAASEPLRPALVRLSAGGVVVYGSLFGIGELILGSLWRGVLMLAVAAVLLAWIVLGKQATASAAELTPSVDSVS